MSTIVTEHDFRCPICDSDSKWSLVHNDEGEVIESKCNTGNWENVDQYRHKPCGMSLCKICGFVTYPTLYKTEEEIKKYYRNDYRMPPKTVNLYTGERKLHMHHAFLNEYFDRWKDKKDLVVGEVGAAFGMVLKWFKSIFPEADVHGTELTTSFKRVAYHEYGLDLQDDLDLTKRYSLIMSYKVQEHMCDPDKKLRQYVEALKPDGLIYISVPCWFDKMYNFGQGGFDLEYYYSTSHINTWSQKLFETMLKKCGLEIIKQDHVMYDSTYMCKRNDALMDETREYEDPEKIKWSLDRIYRAAQAFETQDYEQSVGLWPNFPMAWQGRYEMNRNKIHKMGWEGIEEQILEPMLKHAKSIETLQIKADLAMRYNKWKIALDVLNELANMKPGNPPVYVALKNCYINMGIEEQKKNNVDGQIEYLCKARDVVKELMAISMQMREQATDWKFWLDSQIPTTKELDRATV